MKHYEIEGAMYENFLQRFFRYDRRISRPQKSEFIQLIESKNKGSDDFERCFTQIKIRLNKALEILEEKEIEKTGTSSNLLPILLSMVENSKNTEDLNKFINFALSQTRNYK